jgi:hypothetical protein
MDGIDWWASAVAVVLFIGTMAWLVVLIFWHKNPAESFLRWFVDIWFDPWKKRKRRDRDGDQK